MTVLYFTSTGNSLSAAKRLGGTLISIPQLLRTGADCVADDAVGLVFPVYGLSVPPIVLELMERVTLRTGYLFAVLTYGTYAAGAGEQLLSAAAAQGETVSYLNTLHMQENYLPGFVMEKQKTPKTQADALARICADVAARRRWLRPCSGFDRFMTRIHQKNYRYRRGEGVTQALRVEAGCAGCGVCSRVCPAQNIRMEGGRPVFGRDCLSCLACVQNCPGGALRLLTEKSGARYRCPDVSLEELSRANGPAEPMGGA